PGSLAAGTGSEVPDLPPEYTFLRRNQLNARADGIALVDGCSMEPVYHSGDYVYYQAASSADPGEDVLVDTDDGAVIKRVGADYTLCSVNPALPYPAKSEQNTLVIRGRVLGVVSSSDQPSEGDAASLEELFADEIRAFRTRHPAR
ncbi:MAG: S24 family peptidase, partial [Bacteroidales bacterium]|nr:S24 family peptidase [Bacteroidales bacterium]